MTSRSGQTVYFVHAAPEQWPRGVQDAAASWDALFATLSRAEGSINWILQAYVHLKRMGCPVALSDRLVPGAMNVLHYDHLTIRSLSFRAFVIVVRADRGEPPLGDLEIVQNRLNVSPGGREWWVPHWPQPGLIPRDPARRGRIENVAYYGLTRYLAPEFSGDAFQAELAAMGMRLRIYEGTTRCGDYRETDAVLAVRDVSPYDLSIKPPSKLVNAWHARCAPLLGPEPAYQQIGRPGTDYLEVATPRAALAALRGLRDDPGRYDRLLRAGQDRAQAYTTQRIALTWADWLWGPAQDRYHAWRREGRPIPPLYRAARHPWRALQHKRARRYFQNHI